MKDAWRWLENSGVASHIIPLLGLVQRRAGLSSYDQAQRSKIANANDQSHSPEAYFLTLDLQ